MFMFEVLLIDLFYDYDYVYCMVIVLVWVEEQVCVDGVCLMLVCCCVLEILLELYWVMGVYDVLECLVVEGFGKQFFVVYCVLDFLVEQGFVYWVCCLNVYVVCLLEYCDYVFGFLICCNCEQVVEVESFGLYDVLVVLVVESGFVIECSIVELLGLCCVCVKVEMVVQV